MRCTRRDCVLMNGAIGQVRYQRIYPIGWSGVGRRGACAKARSWWKPASPMSVTRADCKQCRSFYRHRLMRWRAGMIIALAVAMGSLASAGTESSASSTVSEEPPRFDFALETAYLFGAVNPPANYEISANFLTARVRWGD